MNVEMPMNQDVGHAGPIEPQAPVTPQIARTLNVKLKTKFVQERLTNEYLDRVIWFLNKANKMSIWMLLMSNQA